jgi:ligand-binding SRPBCC domain-containing protein
MFLFSDTDKNNPLTVRYWIHRNNMTTETNWNPLWLDFIPSILNIVDVFQMNTDELHQYIDDTITLRILESI